MIDPYDEALSHFIDSLPEDHSAAQQLLDATAPFSGQGDLPALAELATVLRSVPPHTPRPEWMAASKARLMAAPVLPPEKRGFTWLGSMFLPLTQLSLPSISLPRLTLPSPVFARAVMAAVLIMTLASVAHNRTGQNPILQVTADQAPVQSAQQAIAATQAEVARLADVSQSQVAGVEIQGTPRDVVLLSKRLELAELAIEQAPPAQQPQLRSQLQGVVHAVRFDGELEAVTNGSTLQVSGVAVQADPAIVQRLKVGQPVSLLVSVTGDGKLQAVQVTTHAPASAPSVSSQSASPTSSAAPSLPPAAGSTAPQTSAAIPGSAPAASAATVSGSLAASPAPAAPPAPADGSSSSTSVHASNSDSGPDKHTPDDSAKTDSPKVDKSRGNLAAIITALQDNDDSSDGSVVVSTGKDKVETRSDNVTAAVASLVSTVTAGSQASSITASGSQSSPPASAPPAPPTVSTPPSSAGASHAASVAATIVSAVAASSQSAPHGSSGLAPTSGNSQAAVQTAGKQSPPAKQNSPDSGHSQSQQARPAAPPPPPPPPAMPKITLPSIPAPAQPGAGHAQNDHQDQKASKTDKKDH